ncbi:F-box/kelch-repeat protein, partial [Trifolium medium]|nr:F-box/kelch-repeat protein [Trifolium medium]
MQPLSASAGATSSQSPIEDTTTTEILTSPSTGDSLLPFVLIKEILCRLPVKFLMQFQCVGKSWKSLISNDYKFAKKHLHMSLNCPRQSRHHLIQQSQYGILPFSFLSISSLFNAVSDAFIAQTKLRYPPILDVGFSQAVGSCHGIVCFSIPHFVVFWNPSIGKFKISPVLEKGSPLRTSIKYGFGYDHSNDNYKMVTISVYDDPKTEVNVHTLGTNCWRRIQEFPCGVPVCESGKFVGGALNWV